LIGWRDPPPWWTFWGPLCGSTPKRICLTGGLLGAPIKELPDWPTTQWRVGGPQSLPYVKV